MKQSLQWSIGSLSWHTRQIIDLAHEIRSNKCVLLLELLHFYLQTNASRSINITATFLPCPAGRTVPQVSAGTGYFLFTPGWTLITFVGFLGEPITMLCAGVECWVSSLATASIDYTYTTQASLTHICTKRNSGPQIHSIPTCSVTICIQKCYPAKQHILIPCVNGVCILICPLHSGVHQTASKCNHILAASVCSRWKENSVTF